MTGQGNIILNDGLLINSGPGVIGAQGKIASDHFYNQTLKNTLAIWMKGNLVLNNGTVDNTAQILLGSDQVDSQLDTTSKSHQVTT